VNVAFWFHSKLAICGQASRRLYVDAPLSPQARVELDRAQAHYLCTVLRLGEGAELLAFNSKDGEWRVALTLERRRSAALIAKERIRPQEPPGDLHYLFAPLKQARQDYLVQKAVEMGASLLQPVWTRHTNAERLNESRMRANVIEAAEQCGILAVPEVAAPAHLHALLAAWPHERLLIFCDEDAAVQDPILALQAARAKFATIPPLAVLIGPEGGFDPAERLSLLAQPCVLQLSLGPRILRADTAAVAALALVQAVLGDWRA
jgi:16S rRNA (uracil1498-N3)-methyltransferase